MKLSKAIELNEEAVRSLRDHKFIDHADAIILGIEALKAVKKFQSMGSKICPLRLPGETEE